MNIFSFNRINLAYELTQSFGEKQLCRNESTNNLIFIHGGIIANANLPLITKSDILIHNYNILHYHRRGYGLSSHIDTDITINDQAKDCKELLDYLKIQKAHILGHSIGGSIAIEFAYMYKSYVKSLILLEPAITGYNQYSNFNVINAFDTMIVKYDKGYREDVMINFMNLAIGKDFKRIIENVLPSNSFNMSVIDADIFFHNEINAMKSWIFTERHARNLSDIPILHIFGKQKDRPISQERDKLLLKMLPNIKSCSIQEAPHMLQITNYHEVSEIISSFISKI